MQKSHAQKHKSKIDKRLGLYVYVRWTHLSLGCSGYRPEKC